MAVDFMRSSLPPDAPAPRRARVTGPSKLVGRGERDYSESWIVVDADRLLAVEKVKT